MDRWLRRNDGYRSMVPGNSQMDAKEADRIGNQIAGLVEGGQSAQALVVLDPILSTKIPFRLLDRIGARIGAVSLPETNVFLERIAREKKMGGWPLIGSALAGQLARDWEGALDRCRAFMISADVWYAADTLAERLPGAALVANFERTLPLLARWRSDPDRWVRKSVGVAIHFWTKRSQGKVHHLPRVKKLLAFLDPMFIEQDLDAVKGAGWALKTLGRYYPAAVTQWLEREVVRRPHYRALMLRKAVTYLPPKNRTRILKAAAR